MVAAPGRDVAEKLEKLSVADALNAIRFAEVVIVLVDAQAPFEEQDIRIADLVEREGRALVIGINKVDLIERQPGVRPRLREEADRALPQVKGVPVVALSATSGDGRTQSFSVTGTGGASAARNRRPPHPARLYDATQVAAADFRVVLVARILAPRNIPPLSGQRLA